MKTVKVVQLTSLALIVTGLAGIAPIVYFRYKLAMASPVPVIPVKVPTADNQQPKKKLSFKEQRELETIEKEMPELEKKRAEILEKLNNEADYEKIATLSAELEKVSEKLEEYEMRWLELQEILN
jgi:ATP-binding cassette subfamily F protein uup